MGTLDIESNYAQVPDQETPERYPALKLIITLLRVGAIATLIVGLIAIAVRVSVASIPLPETILTLAALTFGSLCMFGFAELLRVLIDIERNTRREA